MRIKTQPLLLEVLAAVVGQPKRVRLKPGGSCTLCRGRLKLRDVYREGKGFTVHEECANKASYQIVRYVGSFEGKP